MLDSTQHYEDDRGYNFTGMSESWKRLCLDLPCSERVQIWPIYAQQSIAATIGDQEVLIQVWKGDCPHVASGLPGGIGGEVGIYRRVPGRPIPRDLKIPALDEFPASWRPELEVIASKVIRRAVGDVEDQIDHWWPFPLATTIEMSFSHDGHPFFTAAPTEPPTPGDRVYWMSRWMTYGSYAHYVASQLVHGHLVPLRTLHYDMSFSIGGVRFCWDADGLRQLAQPAT